MNTAAAKKQDVEESREARPFVKWVGGKRSSLDLLLKYVPAKFLRYHEPMVGGGALFFALANQRRFKTAGINDVNHDLANIYEVVREDVTGLVSRLNAMKYSKREYLARRSKVPKNLIDRAARFIYLNKCGFNGLYRVNRAGDFNVPFGRYDNPTICDEENLRACSRILQGVEIVGGDYAELEYRKGDVVYFDPPYVPVSETSNFTAFGPGGWKQADHERLAEFFHSLAKRGCRVMLSNSDTSVARKLYRGFKIVKTKVARAISCDAKGRGAVGEILVLANL